MVKGGRIVEQGTHKELMAKPDGAYAALAKLQLAATPTPAAATDPGAEEVLEKESQLISELSAADSALSLQPSIEKQVSSCAYIP